METAERNELSSADIRKDMHSVRNGASGAGKRRARTGIAAPELPRAEPAAARARRGAAALPGAVSEPPLRRCPRRQRRRGARPAGSRARPPAPAPRFAALRALTLGGLPHGARERPREEDVHHAGGPLRTGSDARCGMRSRRSTTTRAERGGGRARPPGPAPPGRAVMSTRSGRGRGGGADLTARPPEAIGGRGESPRIGPAEQWARGGRGAGRTPRGTRPGAARRRHGRGGCRGGSSSAP